MQEIGSLGQAVQHVLQQLLGIVEVVQTQVCLHTGQIVVGPVLRATLTFFLKGIQQFLPGNEQVAKLAKLLLGSIDVA